MGLFGKKKTENVSPKTENTSNAVSGSKMNVKILGSGCKNCNDLEAATIDALNSTGIDFSVDHVTDFTEIASYGVMSTPALVVNGKVLSYGKVLKKDDVIKLIEKGQ